MNWVSVIAPVISNKITVFGVVAVFCVWAAVSLALLCVGVRRLSGSLKVARNFIADSADAATFAGRYEAVNARLERDTVLGARWREFRESLVLPVRAGQPVRATTRPEAWFNLGLMRSPEIGVDLRYHAA